MSHHCTVVIALKGDKVKVCEVYGYEDILPHPRAATRFKQLTKIYGGANVCYASRKIR